jgi:hypothetical protein
MLRTKVMATIGALGLFALTAASGLGLATASPAYAKGPCAYTVWVSSAAVRENPDINSVVRKVQVLRQRCKWPVPPRIRHRRRRLVHRRRLQLRHRPHGWIRSSQLV